MNRTHPDNYPPWYPDNYPSWFWACRERANVKDRTGYWCNRAIHAIENGAYLYVTWEELDEVKKLLGEYGPPYNGAREHYDSLKIIVTQPEIPLTTLTTDVLVDCLDTLNVGRKLSVRET